MKRILVLMLLLLVSAIFVSTAFAGVPHNKATGTITWTARTNRPPEEQLPGLVTSFNAHDDAPGAYSDRGTIETYRPYKPNFPTFAAGSITIELECVHVDGNQAWFAGTAVSGSGGYSGSVGKVYLYWVKDISTSGAEGPDLLGGMPYSSIGAACADVEIGGWTGTGKVTGGNLKVFYGDE